MYKHCIQNNYNINGRLVQHIEIRQSYCKKATFTGYVTNYLITPRVIFTFVIVTKSYNEYVIYIKFI